MQLHSTISDLDHWFVRRHTLTPKLVPLQQCVFHRSFVPYPDVQCAEARVHRMDTQAIAGIPATIQSSAKLLRWIVRAVGRVMNNV